jgi:CBS domain containing-hemolysin-like protein
MFWLALAGLLLTCLAAIGARSLAEFSPHEIKEICRRRRTPDRLGQILKRHDQVALAAETLQVVATAVFIGAAVFWVWAAWEAQEPPSWAWRAAWLAAGAVALLAVEIWIPWSVVRLWANPFLYHTWPLWLAVSFLLAPLVVLARFVDAVMHRLAGRTPAEPDEESFEEDIRTIVTEGHREGLLEEDAREMIEGVIELGDLDVSEIMTPRTDMVCMPMSLSWQEALEFVVDVGHTRIPVTNKNLDDIVGILYVRDLLPQLAKGPQPPERPWTGLLRDPYFVPETKPIDVLLQEFQQTRNHMAVVLDEYGGVSGLVTMEDVLEEIVGEIVDEYDQDLVDGIRQLDDHLSEALGKVHIDEINQRLGIELPDDGDFDTIAGFVFSRLGHVPDVSEELLAGNVRITVLEATPRRIERVRIEILDHPRRETA